ncbi:MAG: hypothetical protein ACE5GO_01010 [Anaerolineales bacterium]
MNARRPRTVTLLSVGVLTIAILFLTRLVQAVNRWGFFVDLSVSPLYLAATGAAFGAAGILVAWGLWQGKPWGGAVGPLLFPGDCPILLDRPAVDRKVGH